MATIKVYGWTASPSDFKGRGLTLSQLRGAGVGGSQFRAVVAATSMRKVAEIVGVADPRSLHCLTETANDVEERVALSSPGVVFVAPSTGANVVSWTALPAAGPTDHAAADAAHDDALLDGVGQGSHRELEAVAWAVVNGPAVPHADVALAAWLEEGRVEVDPDVARAAVRRVLARAVERSARGGKD